MPTQTTKTWWCSSSGRIELEFTHDQVRRVAHSGDCYSDASAVVRFEMKAQLAAIKPNVLRAELKEYGAWDADDLKDHKENLIRLVWIAGCDLADDFAEGTNNMNKHTAGSWVVCTHWDDSGYSYSIIPAEQGTLDRKERAKLIGAAPEMLETLKEVRALYAELRRTIDDGHWFAGDLDRVGDLAMRAITKAEGK